MEYSPEYDETGLEADIMIAGSAVRGFMRARQRLHKAYGDHHHHPKGPRDFSKVRDEYVSACKDFEEAKNMLRPFVNEWLHDLFMFESLGETDERLFE